MTFSPVLRAFVALSTTAVLLVLTSCASRSAASPEGGPNTPGSCSATGVQLSLATGNAGGVYHALGSGIAELISQKTEMRMTAAETGASVQNIQSLVAGTHQVAFSLADSATDAVNGNEPFGNPQPIQALARIHTNFTQVIARTDSGINTLADMRGKVVSTGSPQSGTEVIANRLLRSTGYDPAVDVQAQKLDINKSIAGLRAGSIDALFWSGGLPTAAIADLFKANAGLVKFIDISDQLPELRKTSDAYEVGEIAASVYGTADAIKTIVVPNLLLVKDGFPANNACALTKTIFENLEQLAQSHPVAQTLKIEDAAETGSVRLSPGSQQALDQLK